MALSDNSISLDDSTLAAEPRLAIVMGTEGDGLPHETIAYRGASYRITVENPDGAEYGVKEITVDGRALGGNVIPPAPAGASVDVRVVMG